MVLAIVHTLAGKLGDVLRSIWKALMQKRDVGELRKKECLHGKTSCQPPSHTQHYQYLSVFRLYKISCLSPWLHLAWSLHHWAKQCLGSLLQRPFSTWSDEWSCLAVRFAGSAPALGHLPAFPQLAQIWPESLAVLDGVFRICVSLWRQLIS